MASVNKRLLGTETTRSLRDKGVESRICGLSANTLEDSFLNAGTDCVLLTRLPCQTEALRQVILSMIDRGKIHIQRAVNTA